MDLLSLTQSLLMPERMKHRNHILDGKINGVDIGNGALGLPYPLLHQVRGTDNEDPYRRDVSGGCQGYEGVG